LRHDATDRLILTRRKLDVSLVALGFVAVLVLVTSAGLLQWGSSFSRDYVRDELSSQNITFKSAADLTAEGRDDLVKFADTTLDSGPEAQAYASYIGGHLDKIGGGKSYADLGGDETIAKDAVAAAVVAKAPSNEIDALQTKADSVTATRNTLFKGETLRGLLLSAYAWSTVGRIAGIAAFGAAVAAAVTAMLVIPGLNHLRTNRLSS
jgi:hypothetical protein